MTPLHALSLVLALALPSWPALGGDDALSRETLKGLPGVNVVVEVVDEDAKRAGFECQLQLTDKDLMLDEDLLTAVFRIFQETLTNVVRHAEATKVRVELREDADELVLIVQDNGKGMTESQITRSKSLGLIGMQERARSWGGRVMFLATPGQGTTVTVRVPMVNATEET